ncbi:MAG: fumarylacetoacetate hydrolase family protein [Maricaulaceae bacterium]
MTAFVLPPPPIPSLAVRNMAARFPIGRVFCIGKNYADHVVEMGGDPASDPPVVFLKPASSVVESPANLAYPKATRDLHHEVELVLALKAGEPRLDSVFGYAAGLDLTRRDLQAAAKAKGGPWDAAKSFEGAAIVSPIAPVADIGHPERARIWFEADGVTRQDGDIGQMILKPLAVLQALDALFDLAAGDLVFTGTPAGVGPLAPGAMGQGGVEGVGEVRLALRPRDTAAP